MSLALNNIGHLVTNDPSIGNGPLGIINNAGLVADDEGNIVWCGPQDQIDQYTEAQPIDCYGCAIIPGFVDSHTHIVFAGDAQLSLRLVWRAFRMKLAVFRAP